MLRWVDGWGRNVEEAVHFSFDTQQDAAKHDIVNLCMICSVSQPQPFHAAFSSRTKRCIQTKKSFPWHTRTLCVEIDRCVMKMTIFRVQAAAMQQKVALIKGADPKSL